MAGPRILVIAEAFQPSGYATVMEGLLPHLAGRCELHLFALSYAGADLRTAWNIYGNRREGDAWGVESVERLLRDVEPDIVLVVYDTFVYLIHSKVLEDAPCTPRTVLYCPIDGLKPDPACVAAFEKLDRLVLFNETARQTVRNAVALTVPVDVIPHGVDTGVFRPLDRRQARRNTFPGRPDLENAFVVLNANRNSIRKRLDLTIEGFARFAQGKKDVYLCLHTDREKPFDLTLLARQCGVTDRIICTAEEPGHPHFDAARLNLLYNACDVGINTSRGEGWGLVSFEHAATGAPQIVPRHSACAELWEGAAIFLEPIAPVREVFGFCEQADVCADDVSEALGRLYSDKNLREEMAGRAYRLATAERYNWAFIATRWQQIFTEMMHTESRRRPD